MANIFIDPYLFACPSADLGRNKFENYINNLLEWKELKDNKWTTLFTLRETHDVLWANNKYPLWDDLKVLFAKFGVDYIQPKDIVILVNAFLHQIIKVQDYLSISDYLVEEFAITSPIKNREILFIEKLGDLLSFASLKCILEEEPESYQLILVSDYEFNRIAIASKIVLIEFKKAVNLEYPILINKEFNCCVDFERVCHIINVEKIWIDSVDDDSIKEAIVLHAFRTSIEIGNRIERNELGNFRFGVNFLQSVHDLHLDNNVDRISVILRSISETLLKLNLHGTHAIRTGKGGNNPQLTNGEYKAWRRDIDHEFHLHYWEKEDQIIFANVVTHNDFGITIPGLP